MTVRFVIWVKTDKGLEFPAFHWTRDAASGIARAIREGQEVFGLKIVAAWAVAVGEAA